MKRRLLCWLGFHGPRWVGDVPDWPLSDRPEGEAFVRVCQCCGARWEGGQRYYRHSRGFAPWRRVA